MPDPTAPFVAALSPAQRTRLRKADADRITAGLDLILKTLEGVDHTCLLWADDVCQDAEARLGVPLGEGESVIRDPEYVAALNFCGDVQVLRKQAKALAERFARFGQERTGEEGGEQ